MGGPTQLPTFFGGGGEEGYLDAGQKLGDAGGRGHVHPEGGVGGAWGDPISRVGGGPLPSTEPPHRVACPPLVQIGHRQAGAFLCQAGADSSADAAGASWGGVGGGGVTRGGVSPVGAPQDIHPAPPPPVVSVTTPHGTRDSLCVCVCVPKVTPVGACHPPQVPPVGPPPQNCHPWGLSPP